MALWIVATPIGTLGDLSPRAREVLGMVDVILAEDTRHTRKLLSASEIRTPRMIALHAKNEDGASAGLAELCLTQEVALVSDAGTPGISDPGTQLVAAAHALGVSVKSVPGPSALATALAATGFPAAPSHFLGFAPRKKRDAFARAMLEYEGTVVVYEAPTRVLDLLSRLAALQPERTACLCRELSKAYEEVRRASLAALSEVEEPRGECVLVVGPGEPLARAEATLDGSRLKDVAKVLASRWQRPVRDVYQQLLDLE